MMEKRMVLFVAVIMGMSLFSGCATNIHPPNEANVPPTEKLGNFTNITLESSVVEPKYGDNVSNRKAVNKIDEVMNQRLKTVFPQLNSQKNNAGKALVIKPQILAIKFISGGKRAWAGAIAGDSAVLLQVDFFDQQKKTIIASPKFYAKANAITGDYSMGGSDNAMLQRIVSAVVEYSTKHK